MKIKVLEEFLYDYLESGKFSDYAVNGLQVEGREEIESIALGVSASMALFEKAKQEKADTILVHHGLFWGNSHEPLKGVLGNRVGYLFRNNLNLFGFHLPLDRHPLVGNNACIADAVGLENDARISFARHGGADIGILGELTSSVSVEAVEKILLNFFGQISEKYLFGKNKVKSIAIVSGGASSDVYEAYEKGADLFITGEAKEPIQEWCREAGMNYIAGGHYATEQFGVKKLGEVISKEFDIPCRYIDIPNRA